MEQRYKIAIEAQRIFRKKKHGMDMVAIELINYLQKVDTVNQYVVLVAPGPSRDCIKETSNFQIVELPASNYLKWEQITLPKAVKEYQCHLLHCTSNTAPLMLKIPLVTTIHDIIYLESFAPFIKSQSLYQRLGFLYRRLVVPSIARYSTTVLTVSQYEKKVIDNYFHFPASKVQVAYNSFSKHFTNKGDDGDDAILKELELPEEYILFLGNTDPKKNTRNVLHAYALYMANEIDPLPLVLPDFNRELLRSYLPLKHRPILMQHIFTPGYVPNEWLPALYRNTSLFLYPSLRESFGIPLLEAMACGAPVLTSNTSAMPEIAKDAAVYADPFNVEDMAEQMQAILADADRASENVSKGLLRIRDFSWQLSAEKVHAIYTDVLHRFETSALQTAQ